MNCVNLAAQNPYCEWDSKHRTGNITNITDLILNEGEGCSFLFILKDALTSGWSSSCGIQISVDGVDYGIVTLPWQQGNYAEIIKMLPSGKVQFTWLGSYDYLRNCFRIYNSSNELIYESPYPGLDDEVFLIYQNECPECIPLTDFEGIYIAEEHQVNLNWTAPESADLIGFDIYRNDILIDHLSLSIVFYFDNTAELEDGDYKYCVVPVYPSECTLDEECFETYISNEGIVDNKDNILIYPNPATHSINISGNMVSEVRIYNNIGQLILTQHNTNTINVSKLTNGIYILSIEISTGYISHKKIIINH